MKTFLAKIVKFGDARFTDYKLLTADSREEADAKLQQVLSELTAIGTGDYSGNIQDSL